MGDPACWGFSWEMQNTFFVDPPLAKEKVRQPQSPCTSAEPPRVHGMQRIAGLEELDSKWHEEVVEEQVDWEFQYRLV